MNNPYEDIVNCQISGDKTIKDLLTYNGVCYWWFIDIPLYFNLCFGLPLLKDFQIRCLLLLVRYVPIFIPLLTLFATLFWNLHVLLSRKDGIKNNSVNEIYYRVLFPEWRTICDDSGVHYKNIYHSDIIDQLLKKKQVKLLFNFSLNLSSSKKYLQLSSNLNILGIRSTYLEKYWSKNTFKEQFEATRYFKKIWECIDKNDDWVKLWAKASGKEFKHIHQYLKFLILIILPYSVWYVGLCENFIIKNQPSVIVMRDEQTNSGRGLVYMARKYSIPTVGIQHGNIAQHPAYLYHSPLDISLSKTDLAKTFPVPSLTCVWGEAEYDLLVNKAGYLKEQVVVTGNPRYDYLGSASERYSREAFCLRYGFDPKQKIILYATASHGFTFNDNQRYLTEVLTSVDNLHDVVLIIKQHPREGDIYTNWIRQSISEYKSNVQIIVPDKVSDTTEMVYFSDIIILHSSTTGQEAVAFHKPLIVMDFSDKPDYAEYVKEGVALGAYVEGSLKEKIVEILDGKHNFTRQQDLYIKKHMYKIDGQAAIRCSDIILNCISKEKR